MELILVPWIQIQRLRSVAAIGRTLEAMSSPLPRRTTPGKWFEEEFGMQTSDDSGASGDELRKDNANAEDATEVIRWYQFQIAAKTVRALMSRGDHESDDDEK